MQRRVTRVLARAGVCVDMSVFRDGAAGAAVAARLDRVRRIDDALSAISLTADFDQTPAGLAMNPMESERCETGGAEDDEEECDV